MHSPAGRHLPGTLTMYSSSGTTGGSVRVTSTTEGTSDGGTYSVTASVTASIDSTSVAAHVTETRGVAGTEADANVATLPSCSISTSASSVAKVTKFSTLWKGDGLKAPTAGMDERSAAAFSSMVAGTSSTVVVVVVVGTADAPAASPPERKPEASMRSRPVTCVCGGARASMTRATRAGGGSRFLEYAKK